MAEITAASVKELRERTGAGMMENGQVTREELESAAKRRRAERTQAGPNKKN